MALATFVPLALNAGAVVFLDWHIVWAGWLGTVMAAVTVLLHGDDLCIDQGNRRLAHQADAGQLPAVFPRRPGTLAASFFAAGGRGALGGTGRGGILLLAAAWAAKLAWRNRVEPDGRARRQETATGLGAIGKVRLFEPPHTNDNYLTREMGFRIARKACVKTVPDRLRCGLAGAAGAGGGGAVCCRPEVRQCCLGWPFSRMAPACWSSAGCSSPRRGTRS